MKKQNNINKIHFIGIFLLLSFYVYADFDPNDITSNSVNLTTENFYSSLISKDLKKRNAARLYLLGVTDTTEGKSWCGYSIVKTVSIREVLYEEIEKLSKEELQSRAAHKIEEILSKKLPCRKKQ